MAYHFRCYVTKILSSILGSPFLFQLSPLLGLLTQESRCLIVRKLRQHMERPMWEEIGAFCQ